MKRVIAGIANILTRHEKIKLGKLILFDLVIGVLDVAFLGMILFVINFYTENLSAANTAFLPKALANKDSLLLISVFFALFALKNWFGFLNSKLQKRFFYGISSRLSKRNIGYYLKDDYLRFVTIDSSVLIRKISHQPIEFSNYILLNVQLIVSQCVLIAVTLSAILFYHPALFFLLFLLLLPPVMLLAYFIRRKLKLIRVNVKTASQKAIQHLQETLSGFIESNVYHKNVFFIARYYEHQLQLNNNIATQQTLQGLTARLIEVFAILGFFILVVINKLSTAAPAISMVTIGVFLAAAYKIIPGVVNILNSAGQIKTYEFTITDLQPVNTESVNADVEPAEQINAIVFDAIGFKYKDDNILKNFSFEMQSGDFTGISGVSGKGKTTLINLLLGFLKQEEGDIYINHKKMEQASRQRYWSRISYVKQQPFIINDTLLKNITLSDSATDDNKLAGVIAFCGMENLIAQYPEGINKQVMENGKNISGGQRQRIMLARALYHDFDVLILDEAFAEMDETSERNILEKLQGLAQQGKIIILITHNRASLSFCDKVIWLDEAYA